MHQTQNIDAMLFYCLASVADSDTALNQQRSQNPEIKNSNQSLIIEITQQYLKWSPKNAQNAVQTLLLLEKSQFFSSYIWAMPRYIDFTTKL